ncbi:MAG: glycosyltransferase family 4 protein [Planctomycetes bacterium]|nr:glycosyltransferase family 4 protein [Planctomycetota bacterium]MBU1517465.1 glycosyltransferase family 4 protein [Planctomycetota bacterium]MBU2457064.1 glycosyltransferase family 4 protein [Planctomycetota bacterium]MBU2596204.1 glycosyltransferase family 4 protein [Planctomycetota bacterium]
MLGWEFPPFISGGLGTACYGLTKAMSKLGLEITFVLPRAIRMENSSTCVKVRTPADVNNGKTEWEVCEQELRNIKFKAIDSALKPYASAETYRHEIEEMIRNKQKLCGMGGGIAGIDEFEAQAHYSGDMYTEVHRYAASAVKLAMQEGFDVIHAHDWMTYPAAMAVAAVSGKPLVVHVHSTEFDRSGENVNQMIYDIERAGMHAASKVIAVSYLTRNIILARYGVSGDKVEVVYNGIERNGNGLNFGRIDINKDEKIVLFLGRITMQKGPEYFLGAAKKVLEVMDNVKFVMAGSGDMMRKTIELAAELGIGSKILFTGFLRGEDVRKVYERADLYVMPSVSEPFGIAPLEALNHDVPVLISKQSGVSEVLTHVLKADFWDVNEIANKIVAVLKYPPLQITLREHGNFEVRKLRWEDAAERCRQIYLQLIEQAVCV